MCVCVGSEICAFCMIVKRYPQSVYTCCIVRFVAHWLKSPNLNSERRGGKKRKDNKSSNGQQRRDRKESQDVPRSRLLGARLCGLQRGQAPVCHQCLNILVSTDINAFLHKKKNQVVHFKIGKECWPPSGSDSYHTYSNACW